MMRGLLLFLAVLLSAALIGLWLLRGPALQAQEGIRVLSTSAESKFPDGILFRIEAGSPQPLKTIAVRFKLANEKVQRYDYVKFEAAASVQAELLVRTDTADRYIPPGAELDYFFDLEDVAGKRLETERRTFTYLDPKFRWEEAKKGLVTVLYHGPVRSRAEVVANAAVDALEKGSRLLGIQADRPLRFTMYNNNLDMVRALPPTSRTLRTALVTEGTTFSEAGVILILGGDPAIRGITAHETMHYVLHLAVEGAVRALIPAWLNEGLAEYMNPESSESYEAALLQAARTNRLLPLTSMGAMPGNPDDVILFYGQSRSLVQYLVEAHGAEKLPQLLKGIRQGRGIDPVLQEVYGFDRVGLDSQWRRTRGVVFSVPTINAEALPTPISWPTVVPFGAETPPPRTEPTPETKAPPSSPAGGEGKRGLACSGAGPGRGVTLDLALLGFVGGLAWLLVVRRR